MDKEIIKNYVYSTQLKIIHNPKGDIFHAMKVAEKSFYGFGEVYFSRINFSETKGWKLHTTMIMNLIVPIGKVELLFQKNQTDNITSIIIGDSNYQRITVMPNIWMAFTGLDEGENILMNFSNIIHNSNESLSRPFLK
ncbi:hypothetical protein LHV13_06245 [Ferrovum sp. PN-J185]|uniref:hypothetical protein n=1 Tax=Ferrovum sp. PN-J185 TaxID=1356306 RepID=UPI001E3E8598|nr:hypothetical protein [Ferrovum sp. PN-J185]MCC6068772.1 hypothetical protein [Ferrovum sp. PN-J185]